MGSVNRSNAPKRLPSSDLENSFFRAWVLRGSEGSNSATLSQPASNASTLSPISPTTQAPERKVRSAGRKGNLSEVNTPKSPLRSSIRGPLAATALPGRAAHSTVQHIQVEEPSLLQTRASTESGISEDKDSTQSSISAGARRLCTVPDIRATPNATKDGRPPREAQKGIKWTHETSGHWLEIRVGRKRSSNESSATASEGVTPIAQTRTVAAPLEYIEESSGITGLTMLPSSLPSFPRPLDTAASNSISSTVSARMESYQIPLLTPKTPKEGLYCRTKRAFGLKRDPAVVGLPPPGQRRMVGDISEVLDRTSSALHQLVQGRRLADRRRGKTTDSSTSASNRTSNMSIAAPSAANRWQSLRTGGTKSSNQSTSSSLRSLTMGRAPVSTPDPEAMYTGSDNNQYFTVVLTDPNAPTFLPSEARRIKTPPLGSLVSKNSKLRGFFFDYTAPLDIDTSSSREYDNSEASRLSRETRVPFLQRVEVTPPNAYEPGRSRLQRERRISRTDWYRVQINAIDAEEKQVREEFVLSVPEHLPNSPMCPRHPKNKSGGKGVCVYHGRNISRTTTTHSATDSASPEMRTPIVGFDYHLES